jgi:nucleoid-associated protein YgaU
MRRSAAIGLIVGAVILVVAVAYWLGRERPLPSPPGGAALPPVAATAPTPTPDAKVPSFDVVRVNPQGEAVIAGRAVPGAEVTVLDGEKPLGKVTADPSGEWVLLPGAPLSPGEHQLSLAQRDAGGAVAKSEGVVAMVVPERRAAAKPATPEDSVALLVPRQGSGAAVPLQLPRLLGGHRRFSLDVIQYDAAGNVLLLGRAPPEAEIEIELDDKAAGNGAAPRSGQWSVPLRQSVPEGKHRLRIGARDKNGALVGKLSLAFSRVAPPEGAVAVDIQPGNNLWRIAQHSYGDGLRYTEIVQANRVQIRDPNLIYPGQVFAVPEKR